MGVKGSYGSRSFGTSMGGLEKSPQRKKREAKRISGQERQWAAKAGTVRTITVDELPPNSKLR